MSRFAALTPLVCLLAVSPAYIRPGALARRVKDINTSVLGGSSSPASLKRFGAFTYFAADDGIHGSELWRTDGRNHTDSCTGELRACGCWRRSAVCRL
jgi:hypothetical protein